MPTVTTFKRLQDANVPMPDPDTGINDFHLPGISLPGLSPGPAILFFRVRANVPSTLQVVVNGSDVVIANIDTSPPRSFHELLSAALLSPDGNQLDLAVVGGGSVVVSDVLLFYPVAV